MKSPFPGMDPFLELPGYWSDFHSRFINVWCEAIADALPPAYEAAIDERVCLVENDPETRKLVYPDVAVTHHDPFLSSTPANSSGATATLAPVTIPLRLLEGPREAFIEILHHTERRLVTTLELLSQGNKAQPGRTEYLGKRQALIPQNVHLVELDLLIQGRRLPLEKPLPPADYYYLLSHGDRRPDCDVFHWNLRQTLPTLPVPLLHPDANILVDLGAVFATAYERGRFGRRIKYQAALPFIREEDRQWVETLTKQQR